jgi:CheY-like chemotaxis protein
VECAHDGAAALDAAARFRPEVVLLDISLPLLDGYEVARRLKADARLTPVPLVVAVTGYAQESDRRQSLEAGFDDHLVKPLDEERLAEVLRRAG